MVTYVSLRSQAVNICGLAMNDVSGCKPLSPGPLYWYELMSKWIVKELSTWLSLPSSILRGFCGVETIEFKNILHNQTVAWLTATIHSNGQNHLIYEWPQVRDIYLPKLRHKPSHITLIILVEWFLFSLEYKILRRETWALKKLMWN